jgi:hypothetical protein
MPSYPGFCGPSYESQSPLASSERCMNLYPERLEMGNQQQVVLYSTPGLKAFSESTSGPCRGLFAQNGRCFVVMANTLYELNSAGTFTSLGTVAGDSNPATFATNGDGGDELFVTSGDQGYLYNLSTGAFSNPVSDVTMGGMLDGYFVALDQSTSTFKMSDLLDGTTWDSTQILQRNAAPDTWQAMLVKNPIILLFGSETTEPIYNAGAAPFPFAPVPNMIIPHGIAAPFSAKAIGNTVLWLTETKDGNRQVVAMMGYNAQRVSTYAVEFALSQYDNVDDAVAYTYQDQGHQFYTLNFPSANATWVFDLSMGMWHERGKWNADAMEYEVWGPEYHAFAFDKHLVGDPCNGVIYHMSTDLFTDVDGKGLRRQRIPPILQSEQRRVFLDRFQLHCDVGVGLLSGQGDDPQVMLQLSRDGGITWGSERWRSAGKMGEYLHRAQWWRLGSGRNLLPSVTMTDPVPWRILDAYINVKGGAH